MSSACNAVRYMYHVSNINTLTVIYFAYFHSRIIYGIIFWGNSTGSERVSVTKETRENLDRN
jgi:hypothetical protein